MPPDLPLEWPAPLDLVARNVAEELGMPPARAALVVCSEEKQPVADAVLAALASRGIEAHLLRLGAPAGPGGAWLRSLVRDLAGSVGLVFLLQPEHASFLFECVGRPDRGLKVGAAHLVCDWLISPAGLARTYGVDLAELRRFRRALLAALAAGKTIRVATDRGTDLAIVPREWHATLGEVYTAPVEGIARGTIVVDGCAYSGPPRRPFALRLEDGRVIDLSDLDPTDEQQRWVLRDLTRDAGAAVLAELGLGVNPGARWDAGLTEAEQARGTCHFGFGHNVAYGGHNASGCHFDLVVRHPTIAVDGVLICRGGDYCLDLPDR